MSTLSSISTQRQVSLLGTENSSFDAVLKSSCHEGSGSSVTENICLGSQENDTAIGFMQLNFDTTNKTCRVTQLVINNDSYTVDAFKNLFVYLFQRCQAEHIGNLSAQVKGKYVPFFNNHDFQFIDPRCEGKPLAPQATYPLRISQEALQQRLASQSSPSTPAPSISQFLMTQPAVSFSIIGRLPTHCVLTVVGEGADIEDKGSLTWDYKNGLSLTTDMRFDETTDSSLEQRRTKALEGKVNFILPEGQNQARIKLILDHQFWLKGEDIIIERGKPSQLTNISVLSFNDAGSDNADHCHRVAHKTLVPISQRDKIEDGRITVTVSNSVLTDSDKHINYKIGIRGTGAGLGWGETQWLKDVGGGQYELPFVFPETLEGEKKEEEKIAFKFVLKSDHSPAFWQKGENLEMKRGEQFSMEISDRNAFFNMSV